MSRFKQSITLFLASIPYGATEANIPYGTNLIPPPSHDDPPPVDLRPLNAPGANIFAAHRSHSSHSSHSSHRSSSGGGSYYPAPADPPATKPPPNTGQQGLLSPGTTKPTAPQLSREEKLKLQIMRVQIALSGLGLHAGPIDGVLSEETKLGLKLFQNLKGLPETGLMTTPTLNALGVPAVQ